MKNLIFILLLTLPVLTIFGSHNRGGEITYIHLGGNTYEFTITTCTDVGPAAQADRDELYIYYGDGSKDTLPRIQEIPQPFDHQKNVYKGIHTFSSAGTYTICMEDPNRNDGILNISSGSSNWGNSDVITFSLQTQLVISPFLGNANNSVQFDECPCPAIACIGKPYCYNPQAVDPDGDSLSYELVAPLGSYDASSGVCTPLGFGTSYVYPHIAGGGTGTMDNATGTYCWDAPNMVGEFNITYKITEWRNGYAVGYVYRDYQVTVDGNCDNNPPVIDAPDDVCVTAGDVVNFNVSATDIDGDVITLNASGNPLTVSSSPATFPSVSSSGSITGNFHWNTNCDHIKPGKYQVLFAVQDNGDPTFSDYESVDITVLPPIVTDVTATPFGNGVVVSWTPTSCNNAEGYHIYRTTNPNFSFGDCCDHPSPEDEGFTHVGTVFGASVNTFTDNTSLTLGINYCYTVTAFYSVNQVESCPSDTACASLKKEVPILTHATVISTDAILGSDSVMWSKPTELDTNQYPGPYFYKVYQGTSMLNILNFVGQTPSANLLYQTDTALIVNNLNTQDHENFFRVELYYTHSGSDSLVGSSNSGGSIFVNTVPNDNEILLSWDEDVPWINTNYDVYRSTSSSGPFSFIGTTNTQQYRDLGLVNGQTYCYFVESTGYYSNPSIINPIINRSQIICDVPTDKTPPCPPTLSINGDCVIGENVLTWNNPNNDCADDVMSYNLYFTPVEGDSMFLIATLTNNQDTTLTHNYNGSVAGCYVVTAIDSAQYGNESDSSNKVCFDNCPEYALPNVFTPNGDGDNDFFHALIPYKYVESIEIEIYNRWGQVIFRTTDPDIDWDGKHQESGEPVSDGVYYYLCTVNTIRLTGIEPIVLTGFIHVFENNGTSGN
ncbi:MAG: gliding motility-associated C-terminal domain-containing protein [Flavobacteriales bacterium]|nr:gliding motility-associated C-terminal domain-containing protein [Flavobacteriales bacterium]